MTVRILLGDVRAKLAELPDESVHCVVTSPPYFGLRDYGTASWEGGDPACDHKQGTARQDGGRVRVDGFNGSAKPDSDKGPMNYRDLCGKCGASRTDKQIGLEPTPAEFVQVMVDVFREVRRVLRRDGTLWLNLGDSYANTPAGNKTPSGVSQTRPSRLAAGLPQYNTQPKDWGGLKQKDLMGIPWRVAFALQADGWYLRQDIIWAKPNPMPESVTDRCTKAHEYLFLLSKSARYFYDNDAIREPHQDENVVDGVYVNPKAVHRDPDNVPPNQGWTGSANGFATRHRDYNPAGRNRRSVWTVATQPFKEAHFATFPPDLIEPCIKAGCPKGGTVLDPFGGAGTTGLVADRLQRDAILIELNPAYAAMMTERIVDDGPLFATITA